MQSGNSQFMDLSSTRFDSKQSVKAILAKFSDLKIRPEKLDTTFEDIANENQKNSGKIDSSPFMDFIPKPMRKITIEELSSVDIDWKMLTLLRPQKDKDIFFFDRIIELTKLVRKSQICSPLKKPENPDNEELNYEYFSYQYKSIDAVKVTEEAPKTCTAVAKEVEADNPKEIVQETKHDKGNVAVTKQRKKRKVLKMQKKTTGIRKVIKKKIHAKKRPNEDGHVKNSKTSKTVKQKSKSKKKRSLFKSGREIQTLVQMTETTVDTEDTVL